MIRRIYSGIILFLFSSISFANTFYAVPSIAYDSFTLHNAAWYGFTPRMSLGYGGPLYDGISLSLEIFGNPRPIKKSSHDNDNDNEPVPDDDTNEVNIRPSWSYGIALYPALELDAAVTFFLHLGLINTKFSSFHEQRVGGQLGGGLGVNLIDCWCVRGEYIYTRYKNINGFGKPSSGEFAVGIIYRIW